MEFYSGYDPFTKRVYVRAPRKAWHKITPARCIICCGHACDEHENLFANPCVGCACNIAVHASCWAKEDRDTCIKCGVQFNVPNVARGPCTQRATELRVALKNLASEPPRTRQRVLWRARGILGTDDVMELVPADTVLRWFGITVLRITFGFFAGIAVCIVVSGL